MFSQLCYWFVFFFSANQELHFPRLALVTCLCSEFHFIHVFANQGPKGGGGSLEPWSPENFCCGARSPIILLTGALILFWLRSPEPKEILRGARSPAFSSLIIRVPRLHRFLITAFFCLFVRVNGRKETESEESTVHNTSIHGYSVYNDMQQLI